MRALHWAVVFGFGLAPGAFGQIEGLLPLEEPSAPVKAEVSDRADLEAFIDGLMAAYREAYHTAGAVVSVVKDGEVALAKGYGYADVEKRTKVDPERTLFRIGSVSKLFVWTAVMQLHEQGKLELDSNVNAYLDAFQIPDTFPEPVTMKHLMSHTAGFEDHIIGLFARTADRVRPLGEILVEEMPARVRPPGVESSYSNHGTALAAHIVERISGQSWDEYVEEHILRPLGMEHTTFRQPVPDGLKGDLSKGYSFEGDVFKEEGFEFVPIAPAGSASASAVDMAKFMIAHLQSGRFGDNRILEAETSRLMQSELFRPAPKLNYMAHGFYVLQRNGEEVIGHGGDTLYFHTILGMVPRHNVGFFASFNSAEGAKATLEFFEAFMDRYFPAPEPPKPEPPSDFAARAKRFEGSYRANRYSHTTIAKVGALMNVIEVKRADDGRALTMSNTGKKRWVEVEPFLFREEDGQDLTAFIEDESGEITRLASAFPALAFEKVRLYETPRAQNALFVAAMFLFVTTLVIVPLGARLRKRYNVTAEMIPRVPFATRLLAWLMSLSFVIFVGGIAVLYQDPFEIAFGMPAGTKELLVVPLVGALFGALLLLATVVAWVRGHGRPLGRLYYTLLVLVTAGFLWQLDYWNLLRYHFTPDGYFYGLL